ncbi:MAG: HWE histidine kinase domain-containing protein [Janthinobacterium lividum]
MPSELAHHAGALRRSSEPMPQVLKTKEQEAAEAKVEGFRDELGPFVVAAETTRMPMVFTDAKVDGNPIIFVNQAFLALTGYDEHEVLAQEFDFLMDRGTDPETLTELQTAFRGGRGLESQVQFRCKDGHLIWVTIFITPVRNKDSDVVQHFASFVDITRHKVEEDRLAFLLDEVNHRTQNMLTTVLAIANQTLRDAADPGLARSFEGRIQALAKAHSLLSGADREMVGLGDVIECILQPFGLRDQKAPRFMIIGEDVRLQPQAALMLAMVFHELATNAAKYGALVTDAGRISVDWMLEAGQDGNKVRLRWQESGGPPVMPPTRQGFGSRLIQHGLAQEVGAEVHLDYAPAGVSCRIVLLLP